MGHGYLGRTLASGRCIWLETLEPSTTLWRRLWLRPLSTARRLVGHWPLQSYLSVAAFVRDEMSEGYPIAWAALLQEHWVIVSASPEAVMQGMVPVLSVSHRNYHNNFPLHRALARVPQAIVATANHLRPDSLAVVCRGRTRSRTPVIAVRHRSGPPATSDRRHRLVQYVANHLPQCRRSLAITPISTILPGSTMTPPSLSLVVVQLVALVMAQLLVRDLHLHDRSHTQHRRREKDRYGRI